MSRGIEVVRDDIGAFAMEPGDLLAYLENLNRLPLHDLYVGYVSGEVAEGSPELFSHEQLTAIREFSRIVEALPPEPDQFWADDSLYGEDWRYVREQARIVLRTLI